MASKTIFTICSNNYLGQATVLGRSIRQHEPDAAFVIVLADAKSTLVDYGQIPFEVLPVASFEPRALELANKYDIIEFNTCIKPRVFEYLFGERKVDRAVYLDPDIRLYAPMTVMNSALDSCSYALTPHSLKPIPRDGKTPADNNFLLFGVYNLGFIGMKNCPESLDLLRWWKESTYEAGYARLPSGMFVDQLYANLMPLYFPAAAILRDEGYNMAPWNLHERALTRDGVSYRVNDRVPLTFFHFSSFRVNSAELPLHYYNRYPMSSRPDLVELFAGYNAELVDAKYANYKQVPWAYERPAPVPKHPLIRKTRRLLRVSLDWAKKGLLSTGSHR